MIKRYSVLVAMITLSLVVCLGLIACATFTKSAYQAGAMSKAGFELTMTGMGELYKEGFIKDPVRDETIKLGKAYKDLHNSAIEALARYKEKGSPTDKQAYLQLASEASVLLAKFLNYVRPYLLDGGKEVP